MNAILAHVNAAFSNFSCGALALGFWLGGLFFLHAYRQTSDRLFMFFTISFWIMMVDRLIWGLLGKPFLEDPQVNLRTAIYAIRFVSFCVIAIGIIDKNRRVATAKPGEDRGLTVVSSSRPSNTVRLPRGGKKESL